MDANYNATGARNDQSLFVLTILEKIEKVKLKVFQGKVTVL